MSLTKEEIDALDGPEKTILTLDEGDVTVEVNLQPPSISTHKYDGRPDEITLFTSNFGGLDTSNVDGLDIDLGTTEITLRVRYTEADDDTVNVLRSTFSIITAVEGADHPVMELWENERNTVEEFELTGVDLVSED